MSANKYNLFHNTPVVTVLDNRGLTVREIQYYRHPDIPENTDTRITRHLFDPRGFLTQSIDPRLSALQQTDNTIKPNFSYLTSLNGAVLRSQSVDSGITVALSDIEGRPSLNINATGVITCWQYEDASLPGRPLSVTEQSEGEVARTTERFFYADNTDAEKNLNLAGRCVSHYDTAGLTQTESIALSGTPLSVTRRFLKNADNPDIVADWQGLDISALNDFLAAEIFTTLNTADANGTVLTITDAKGNLQRVAYDVAGLLVGSWLTLKGGSEQVILKSLTYSPAGQKLREEHGNGVVTTYTYETETQRLTGIKTERPSGHPSGAKVLQDLRYTYDPVGNVLQITNDAEATQFWKNQQVVPENTYTYDSLYQLVTATGREMASLPQQGSTLPVVAVPLPTGADAFTTYIRSWVYDAAGNLTQIRHSGPASGNSYTTTLTVSDRSNRAVLSTLTDDPSKVDTLFDAAGHQNQLQPGQGLIWTPRGELLKVTPVVRNAQSSDVEFYRYDSGSQRISKTSSQETSNSTRTQKVVYLPGIELRTTANGDMIKEDLHTIIVGEAGRAQVRVLHWESGQPDGVSNNQCRYSYDNLLGSSSLELDGSGEIISQEEYYPYGGTAVWTARSQLEADYKTIRYSGKERDATGLYYYGYRYCQPWVGRWLSADPAGMVDGLNLFRMTRNNPISNDDPLGLSPDEHSLLAVIKAGKYEYNKEGTHSNRKNETRRAFATNKDRFGKAGMTSYKPKGGKNAAPTTSSEHIVPNNILIAGAPRIRGKYDLTKENYGMETVSGFIEDAALAYQENDIAHKAHSGTGGHSSKPDATNDNTAYLETMTGLLHSKDISAAIQINQLGYGHNYTFRKLRRDTKKSQFNNWSVNTAADNSFFHSVGNIKKMLYIANSPWDREKKEFTEEPVIDEVHINASDKLESAISRMAIVMERYPTIEELKKFVKQYDYEIPEGYSWLSSDIVEHDKNTPYYTL